MYSALKRCLSRDRYRAVAYTWRVSSDVACLESGRTPVDKLDVSFRFDGRYGVVDIFGHNVAAVQQTAGHVLAMAWITLDHLVGWLETRIRYLCHRVVLVVGAISRHNWRIGRQREVDSRIRNEVCLELCQVDVERAVKTQ